MADLIEVTGTGGARFRVDRSLPWVAAQLDAGQLTPTGTAAAAAPEPEEQGVVQRPAASASKADWVAYIANTTDLSTAEAEALTKAELIEQAEGE
jgi:hypothetical protein